MILALDSLHQIIISTLDTTMIDGIKHSLKSLVFAAQVPMTYAAHGFPKEHYGVESQNDIPVFIFVHSKKRPSTLHDWVHGGLARAKSRMMRQIHCSTLPKGGFRVTHSSTRSSVQDSCLL